MGRVKYLLVLPATVFFATIIISAGLACGNDGTTGPSEYQAPRNLQGTYTGKAVELTWDASVNNEETGYEVWRKRGNGAYANIATLGSQGHVYYDESVAAGNTYIYKVCTLYDGDAGPFSNEVTVNT
jgi:fibronectin type 3 domain-containing protein